jgi:RNA polymerase sigma factor (TIGR02999 family)
MSEITQLLNTLAAGDNHAAEELVPLVYDELRHLAAARMNRNRGPHTLQPTALVHEVWLRLASQGGRNWNSRDHFFRAAAQAMRHILVDLSRQKASLKRGNRPERVCLDDVELITTPVDDRILVVHESLLRLETEDPESARLITLKFFGGFTNPEIARMLGMSERTLERQWAYAKASLFDIIQENRKSPEPSGAAAPDGPPDAPAGG